jgi:peptide/nickel transport system substrate-binding protein
MKRSFLTILSVVLLFSVGLLWGGGGQEAKPAAGAGGGLHGGVLRKAFFAPTNLDPAFLSSITDDEIGRFWGDFLVYVDENLRPDPSRSLAEKWSVGADGLSWTFNLRKGVKFHNGQELTSKDVKFTFDRLRDPKVGAATVALFAGITEILTPDAGTVVFKLKQPNPDLVTNLGDYHTLIVWNGTRDFATEHIGSGAFIIDSYLPEDRMILKRNPNYWRKDAKGNQLPYLDGIQYIFLAEASAQVEALRGGQVDYLLYLPSEYVKTVAADPNLVVYQKPSNTHYVVHMRSDRQPFGDVRVRQAFRAAIDRKAILDGAFQGLGVTGRDTPFGPAYADYYLNVPELPRDLSKAKKLLAEAGYASGLKVTLTTQQSSPVPAMATILKEQLAEAGVTVDIQLVPPDVYYGADNLWLEADFSITDWGARATPQPYLELAYTSGAQWNESHWADPEVDALSKQAAGEADRAKRAEIYKKVQRIFIERGPVLVPFFSNSLWGASRKLKGIVPTGYLGTAVDLAQVYFEK